MQLISFRDVTYKGKGLCDCLIEKDMSLEEALEVYCKIVQDINKNIKLSCVKTGLIGIKDTCDLKCDNLLAEILNALIDSDININNSIDLINIRITNLIASIVVVADEKVKTSSADPTAGFLSDKIATAQPGTISTANDKLTFIGFAPVGSVMFINKSRLSDFEGSGKGKAGTDVYGWAIGNGQNGTVNRLGVFPMYTDDVNNAGTKAGANSVTLTPANIPGFNMNVTGTIAQALTTPVQFQMKFDGIGTIGTGSNYALKGGNGLSGSWNVYTIPANLAHTHTFDLIATRVNSATAISILPSFIKEIPIERIPV